MPIVACGVENDASLASVASCALQLFERDDQVRGGAHGVDAGRRRGGVRRAAMQRDVERGLALVAVDDPKLGRLADDHAGERRGDARARRAAARCPRRRAPRRARSPRAAARSVTTGRTRATAASVAAMKPFMSAAPRPWSRPPSARRTKGSLVQVWPATSTTSPWAASSTPPGASAGPSTACSTCVPGRVPSCTRTSAPASSRTAATSAINSRLSPPAIDGRATRRARSEVASGAHGRGRGPSRPRSPPGSAARRPRPVASREGSRAGPAP